jgi:hypothetical protein
MLSLRIIASVAALFAALILNLLLRSVRRKRPKSQISARRMTPYPRSPA